jgi:hypothetical protein
MPDIDAAGHCQDAGMAAALGLVQALPAGEHYIGDAE